jgi:prophage regulatory protein
MRLLKRPEVESKTGISRAAIYAKILQGTFPKPVKLGAKAVAWVESEVDQFCADRIAERDAKAGA